VYSYPPTVWNRSCRKGAGGKCSGVLAQVSSSPEIRCVAEVPASLRTYSSNLLPTCRGPLRIGPSPVAGRTAHRKVWARIPRCERIHAIRRWPTPSPCNQSEMVSRLRLLTIEQYGGVVTFHRREVLYPISSGLLAPCRGWRRSRQYHVPLFSFQDASGSVLLQ
jgi:hypothetical protein